MSPFWRPRPAGHKAPAFSRHGCLRRIPQGQCRCDFGPPQATKLLLEALEDRTTPTVVDLTSPGSSGSILGAQFIQSDSGPGGTNVVQSFVRIDRNGVEQGYNTSSRPVQFDENNSPNFTRSFRLGEAARVALNGTPYYEFVLQINQNNSPSSQQLISLDQVRLYVSPTNLNTAANGYNPATGTLGGLSPVYDMNPDLSSTSFVELNGGLRLARPASTIDMLLLVPVSDLGTNLSSFVYLYSQFGAHTFTSDQGNTGGAANDGFELWANTAATVPRISTRAGPTQVLGSGARLTDSATLLGGNRPTGAMTFTLTLNGVPVDTETVPVNGNGIYNTPTGFVPTAPGTYQWVASYSGDLDNSPVASDPGDEPQTVVEATPALATLTGPIVVLGRGVNLNDTAFLVRGFNPTGTITFTLRAPRSGVVYTDVVTVSGNGVYSTRQGDNPGGFLPTVPGIYQWVASYSGDANNHPASTDLGDEPQLVIVARPTITTSAGSTLQRTATSPLTDSATLSGGANPTGTITFNLTGPGGGVVYTNVVTVNGNGTYDTSQGSNPGGFVPTVPGVYQWVARYSGDANNRPATSTFGAEPQTVVLASPHINTRPGPDVVVGSGASLTDTATLSGGFSPTGTITFTLTLNGVTVDTETVPVNGNGTYTTPTGFVPTATGTYQWVASYSGDANNHPVSSGVGDEPETAVPAAPDIATTAGSTVVVGNGVPLTDTATLAGGFNPTGTITFTLTLNGVAVDTEAVPVNGNGTYSTPTGFIPTAPGVYQWVASYGGDANNHPVSSTLGDEPQAAVPPGSLVTNTSGTVTIGSGQRLTDSATLSGNVNPTGSITFTLTLNGVTEDTETVPVNGNGTYTTPTGFLPTTTGVYQWVASYSGDSLNPPSSSAPGDEPQTVDPNETTIVTSAGPDVVLGSGASLTDTATLTGGFSPTGTMTFTLTLNGVTVDTETVPVNGNGTYTTPTGFVPTATGTYQWVASYTGDANNGPAASILGDEPEAVTASEPTIDTLAGPTIGLGSGDSLTDTAILAGGTNPTGTITFTLTLGGVTVDTETVPVNGNGTYTTPTGFLPTTPGDYQWVASYSGDASNDPVSSNFGDEPQTVIPAEPTLDTTPGPTSVLGDGTPLTDTAILAGGTDPTGSITFTLTLGTDVVDTETVPVNGNGTYTTPTGFLPTAPGTYQWVASYSGDANNSAVASNLGDEPETVIPADPTIETSSGPTLMLGSGVPLTDTATLSGGVNPTGTITFTLTLGGAVVDTETATVNGNGTYGTPTGFLPTAPGTYQWVASYGGDGNNDPVSSQLGDEPQVVITAEPTLETTAGLTVEVGGGVPLTDTATLSDGFNPTGTITFTLFVPGGGVVDSETVPVNGNGTYTTPTGFVPTVPGIYQWVVDYSGDANNDPVSSGLTDEPQAALLMEADLVLTKTANPSQVVLGQDFTYTLTVQNLGPDTATGVVVHDPLPSGITPSGLFAPGQGTIDAAAGVWNVGTLPSGASTSLVIGARLQTLGPVANSATVSADQFDPNPSAATSTAVVTGMRSAQMVTKQFFLDAFDPPAVTPADAVFASVPAAANGVTLGSPAPAGGLAGLDGLFASLGSGGTLGQPAVSAVAAPALTQPTGGGGAPFDSFGPLYGNTVGAPLDTAGLVAQGQPLAGGGAGAAESSADVLRPLGDDQLVLADL
jgi:uncharacterized repeat protein (TIGR01451 family)